ncbi:FAD binding domain-containing protein [Oceanicola granulosus]|nr:FAD binding domain-containing protein [Oceanicola granulosus]
MYDFAYHRARTLDDARAAFRDADDAAYVSGGHSLLPTMKNRLAAPDRLVHLTAIPELRGIARDGDRLVIGAAETHAGVAASPVVQEAIPALAALAGSIGDPQVRHRGTMGGSVANNDPAADYPSAVLGLGATIHTSEREIDADDFFAGMFTTALDEGEIVTRIAFPVPDSAGYAKMRNPASRYALAASFVARFGGDVRVAITGAGSDGVFRWHEAEEALAARFEPGALDGLAVDPDGMMSDMHASAAFRAHLCAVGTARAVANPGRLTLLA